MWCAGGVRETTWYASLSTRTHVGGTWMCLVCSHIIFILILCNCFSSVASHSLWCVYIHYLLAIWATKLNWNHQHSLIMVSTDFNFILMHLLVYTYQYSKVDNDEPLWHFLPKAGSLRTTWVVLSFAGQVAGVLKEQAAPPVVQGRRHLTSHVSIPAAYKSGITIFMRSDNPNLNTLLQAEELPLLEWPHLSLGLCCGISEWSSPPPPPPYSGVKSCNNFTSGWSPDVMFLNYMAWLGVTL